MHNLFTSCISHIKSLSIFKTFVVYFLGLLIIIMNPLTRLKNKFANLFTSSGNQANEPSTSGSNAAEKLPTFDILAKKSMSSSINEKFLHIFQGTEHLETKRICKILKFPPSLNFEDVSSEISRINCKFFPNLFMFVVETENFGFSGNNQQVEATNQKIKQLKNNLLNLGETRPMILQITSTNENTTKIYFKRENSNFIEIKQSSANDHTFNDFLSFMQHFLTTKITNFEGLMLDKLPMIKDSTLIIRFLRTLRMSKKFFNQLVLNCATRGSKNDLLAAIDAPFEGDGRILSCEAENWINKTISIKQSSSTQPNEETSIHSVLHSAITNTNEEIIDYLTSHCAHLIQQLPVEHQVQISTVAFNGEHYDILCDLLILCDFPFPENFKPDPTENQKLNNIIDDRREFFQSISKVEFNPEEISNFIKDNPNFNIIYNFNNESALFEAITTGKYKAYFHLKSLGFEAVEFDDIDEVIDGEELKEAKKFETQQRRNNVQRSIMDSKLPILLLSGRSSIHDRKTKSEEEEKCREKIRKWFEDIYNSKFGSLLLRTASMCDKLRIIFDFESDSVS